MTQAGCESNHRKDCFPNDSFVYLRKKHPKKRIVSHINTNCLRNKFDLTSKQIKGNNDILMKTMKTKLDESFPVSQFQIDGHSSTFRFDRNSNGVNMLLVQGDIPAKRKGSEF